MFELILVACVGTYCSLEPTPHAYDNVERCEYAAAITGGRIKGALGRRDVDVRFTCRADGASDPQWYAYMDGDLFPVEFDFRLATSRAEAG